MFCQRSKNVDSKKIKAMLTVVRLGSLTAAAEELGYTQPGLTNMMNSLENELGIKLLNRSKTGIRLSRAGSYLIKDAESFVSAAEEFERRVEHLRDRAAASLRIGTYSSIARRWLPFIIKLYKSENPTAEVSTAESDAQNAYDAVRAGDLDLAVVSYRHEMMNGLSWKRLQDDELLGVFPEELAPAQGVASAESFAGQDFLMPSYGFELDVRPALETIKARNLNIKYTNLDDTAIASMVEHGLGVSIMSRLMLTGMSGRLETAALSVPCFRELGIIVSEERQHERSIRSFIEKAEDFLIDRKV